MPPELPPSDEDYASSEDSDFAIDNAAAQDGGEESSDSDSASEESAVQRSSKSKKRKLGANEEAEAIGYDNSGDEAIIERGEKKKRKKVKGKGKQVGFEDDEGGDGGLIKTRSQRAQEKAEKKPLASAATSTIDVDAIWASMLSGKPPPPPPSTEPKPSIEPTALLSPTRPSSNGSLPQDIREARSSSTTLGEGPDSMVMIKRTYTFAGKVHTEQKLVPRNSAEAKLYLASLPSSTISAESKVPEVEELFTKSKRPPKLARRSIFEPVVEGLPQRTDLHFGARKDSDIKLLSAAGMDGGKKLNTVEKSAMDWAGFVDKEGIADELDAACKSKGAYRARQEFLARVEQKKIEDDRRARGLPI